MRWLKNILFPKEHKFTWFVYTLIGSFLPIIFRLLGATSGRIDWFDFKDLLFAGIAINLSNFALAGDREFDHKAYLIGWSIVCMVFSSVSIMVILLTEDNPSRLIWLLYLFSTILVFISIYTSYLANDAVFSKN